MGVKPEILKYFANKIQTELGIIYSEANYYQLESRLTEVATQLGFVDVDALYSESLRGLKDASKQILFDIATNNETSFFRDPNVFQTLQDIVFPKITEERRGKIRAWSAACSSGQEMYSLAILFNEMDFRDYEIFATDVSDRILKRARDGVYSQLEVQRGLSKERLKKFFEERVVDGNPCWAIKSSISRQASFLKLNLLEPWSALPTFDLVLCRNVLIYQSVENRQAVVKKIHDHLYDGGWLILGGGESLLGISEQFEMQTFNKTVVYRKKVK